jgi:sugar phosphate isomerase/epimerase
MTSRRQFINQLAWITAASSLGTDAFALSTHTDKKIGVQLYTVRDNMALDPKGTLEKVASIGFKEVESYGYNGNYFGMSPAEYKKVLKGLGLKSPSGHYLYGDFGTRNTPGTVIHGWEKAIDDAKEVGQEYMVIAYLMDEERSSIDAYKKIAEGLSKAGELCKKSGIQLCYHNHAFEFQSLEGEIPFDVMMKYADPAALQIELDLYWAVKAGKDPIALFEQHKHRISLWHVKDMDKTPDKNFAEVGSGIINFNEIFEKANLSGMKHFFIEQDQCTKPPLESIEQSFRYVKSTLVKHL